VRSAPPRASRPRVALTRSPRRTTRCGPSCAGSRRGRRRCCQHTRGTRRRRGRGRSACSCTSSAPMTSSGWRAIRR
jgi:hypothetical protein